MPWSHLDVKTRLQGEDGHAGGDGDVAPLHGPPSLTRGAGQKRASQVLRRRGTVTVSGMALTLTSAWWLQASHVAVTAAHVLKRHRRAGFATHGRAARLVEDEV